MKARQLPWLLGLACTVGCAVDPGGRDIGANSGKAKVTQNGVTKPLTPGQAQGGGSVFFVALDADTLVDCGSNPSFGVTFQISDQSDVVYKAVDQGAEFVISPDGGNSTSTPATAGTIEITSFDTNTGKIAGKLDFESDTGDVAKGKFNAGACN